MTKAFALLTFFAVLLSARVAAADPSDVVVGVYVNQIHELNLKENNFVVDFYVWFRWRNDALKPYDSFSLVGGRVDQKGELTQRKLSTGENYAYQRYVAQITKFWDISRYPYDAHNLDIMMEEEDTEAHALRYVADLESSAVDPSVAVPGWVVARTALTTQTINYKTNFGDVTAPAGKATSYSRATYTIGIERAGRVYSFKLFFGLWISAAIAFLSFFIKPTNVDPRFGLGVGAIFAAIASEYVVTSALPDTNMVTLADKLHIIAFAFIYIVLAQSTLSLWYFETSREARSKRLDNIFAIALPVVYIAVNLAMMS